MTPRISVHPCGYCQTGHHDLCPTAVRNGAGQPVVCRCCACRPPKCMDCKNQRAGEVDENTRVCIDRAECVNAQRTRREAAPVYKFLREIEETKKMTQESEQKEREFRRAKVSLSAGAHEDLYTDPFNAPRARKTPAVKSGECRCCGGPTKGGKFLPGHDSRYLTALHRDVREDNLTRAEALAFLDDVPALRAKLEKRIS